MDKVLCLIGLIIISIGIIGIYDARKLSRKFFGAKDINNTVKKVKLVGFVICIVGSSFIIF